MSGDLVKGAKAAAEYLGISEGDVRYMAREGQIPVVRLGGRNMWFRKSELDAALSSRTAA